MSGLRCMLGIHDYATTAKYNVDGSGLTLFDMRPDATEYNMNLLVMMTCRRCGRRGAVTKSTRKDCYGKLITSENGVDLDVADEMVSKYENAGVERKLREL